MTLHLDFEIEYLLPFVFLRRRLFRRGFRRGSEQALGPNIKVQSVKKTCFTIEEPGRRNAPLQVTRANVIH